MTSSRNSTPWPQKKPRKDRNTVRINVANYVNWLSKLGTHTTATPPATRPQHSQKIENVHERLRQPADSL